MKTKLRIFCVGLALLTGVHTSFAQITNLGIAPANGQSALYWPVSTTNYVLQTVTNLASTNWVTATTAFAVNAAQVTNSAPSGFFRLQPTTTPAGMALIPAGWFTMGDTLDGDTNPYPTNVYVSAFVMEVNLVNYGLWTNVYAYATSHGYNFANAGANAGAGTNYPAVNMSWYDCVKWCNARSQQAGLTPVYYTNASLTEVFTNGQPGNSEVYQNLNANGYRLPTEAEWEKAARGGGIGRRFPWGDKIHNNQAAYDSDLSYSYDLGPTYTPSGTSSVGSFDVNGYGLYDMAGNIHVWCWDKFGTPYGQPTPINPTGALSGARVLRGCYVSQNAYYARCSYRSSVPLTADGNSIGFRCVRGL